MHYESEVIKETAKKQEWDELAEAKKQEWDELAEAKKQEWDELAEAEEELLVTSNQNRENVEDDFI
jgi:hypothetical protein